MNISQVKQKNREAGQYFFEPDTMRFFRSKVFPETFEDGQGNVYFVTSEQFPGDVRMGIPAGKRLFTIRRMDKETGHVTMIGDFQQYTSKREATKDAFFAALNRREK